MLSPLAASDFGIEAGTTRLQKSLKPRQLKKRKRKTKSWQWDKGQQEPFLSGLI